MRYLFVYKVELLHLIALCHELIYRKFISQTIIGFDVLNIWIFRIAPSKFKTVQVRLFLYLKRHCNYWNCNGFNFVLLNFLLFVLRFLNNKIIVKVFGLTYYCDEEATGVLIVREYSQTLREFFFNKFFVIKRREHGFFNAPSLYVLSRHLFKSLKFLKKFTCL